MPRERKLHELIVERDQLRGQSDAARTDLINTFKNKRHLFEEKRITVQPVAEGAPQVVEAQSDIQTSIASELDWIANLWAKSLDVNAFVDEGNMLARADVILDDGTVIYENLPATQLLDLAKRAGELQELIKTIPTLDPAKGFALDADKPDGTYKARDVRKVRTKKVFVPLVLSPATDKHPAQVKESFEDVVAANVVEQEWSGLITPKLKGEMLERVEELRRAIQTARQRANEQAVNTNGKPISTTMFGYVFKGRII